MKKIFAVSLVLFVLGMIAVSGVSAQQPSLISANNQIRIHRMGVFGNGLAISDSDPMDFELLKIGIAGIKVGLLDDSAEVMTGVLYLGENKYRLREVVIGNGSSSARLYDADGENVGSISLDSYPKGDTEIWAGTLSLSGRMFNAYVIQVPRVERAMEAASKIHEYCKNNPVRCRAAMQAVGQIICDPTDGTCRNRISDFCEANPEDNRCKRLKYEYCKENLDDAGCRAQVMETCKANLNDVVCERLGGIYDKFAEKRPTVANQAPAWIKAVTARVKQRVAAAVTSNAGMNGNQSNNSGTGNQGGQ